MQSPSLSLRSYFGSALLWVALIALLGGCAPEIGDECQNALDCSSSGTRICDRTQPSGYCTIAGCEAKTCPEESVCVKFNPKSDRLSTTYCMLKCDDSSDCRGGNYACLRAMATKEAIMSEESDPGAFGDGIEAEVLDKASQKFCAVRSELPETQADAGAKDAEASSDDDGGTKLSSGG